MIIKPHIYMYKIVLCMTLGLFGTIITLYSCGKKETSKSTSTNQLVGSWKVTKLIDYGGSTPYDATAKLTTCQKNILFIYKSGGEFDGQSPCDTGSVSGGTWVESANNNIVVKDAGGNIELNGTISFSSDGKTSTVDEQAYAGYVYTFAKQ
jgi:hypothetical protein